MAPLCVTGRIVPVEQADTNPLRGHEAFTAPVTGLGSSLGLSPGVTQTHSGTAIFGRCRLG